MIRERAREWAGHLDRMLGVEETTTIDDTCRELREWAEACEPAMEIVA